MIGDTFVLPQAGGDITCKKTNQDAYSSEYMFRNATDQYIVRIRHSKTKAANGVPAKDRHNLEVVHTIFATSTVAEYERKFYFVIEHLPSDTSVALYDAVADKVILTSNLLLTQLLGWES